MHTYLAIFKRDASLHPFNIPMPLIIGVMALLIFTLGTSASIEAGLVWLSLFMVSMTLFSCVKIVDDLSLSSSHNMAYLLPNFKQYQFIYGLGLCGLAAVISSVVLAKSVVGFICYVVLIMCCISCLFLLVNRAVTKTVAVFVLGMMLLGGWLNIYVQKGVFKQWLHEFDVFLSVLSSWQILLLLISLLMITVLNFNISHRRYLKPQEINPSHAPTAWKTVEMQNGLRTRQIQISNLIPDKVIASIRDMTHKMDGLFIFGLANKKLENAIYTDLRYANSAGSVWLLAIVVGACALLFDLVFGHQDYATVLILVYVATLFLWSNILSSLDFLRARKNMPYLWLMSDSKNRQRFMARLLVMHILRFVKTIIVALLIVSLVALLMVCLTEGIQAGSAMFFAMMKVGITIMLCSSLLQLSFTIWITKILPYSMGTRYLTSFFTLLNFVLLGITFYYSVEYSIFYALSYLLTGVVILGASTVAWVRKGLEFAG